MSSFNPFNHYAPVKVLALSGSLRQGSYNTALLTALQQLAPEGMDIQLFQGMGELPLFNPDIEPERVSAVMALKTALAAADGLFIASPEYAHGISGVMKNALDWLVSGEEFVNKPIAIFNASPRASHALAALREIVQTMSGIIIEDASIAVPLLSSQLTAQGIVDHETIAPSLVQALEVFRARLFQLQAVNSAGTSEV